jgi:hypothetical protein
MDLTKLRGALLNLIEWVRDGLSKKADADATTQALGTKQNKVLSGTTDPASASGTEGDVYMVVDP